MDKRLFRSRGDRMLFGVAGGLARYLELDTAIVRIVWALLVLAGGAGILLYIIAALVIPEEPAGWAAAQGAGAGATPGSDGSFAAGAAAGYRASTKRRDGGGAVVIGVVLILVGAWFLLERFLPAIDPDLVWPVVLVVLGGALVVGALRR